MAKELKAKGYNVIPGHSLCRQCVKKDHIMEDYQNESDNDYPCETPRKKLNTSLDTMGISPVHLHGVAQQSRASTAKNKLDRALEVPKTSTAESRRILIPFDRPKNVFVNCFDNVKL